MVAFNFATAQRILFGNGRFCEIGGVAGGFGRRVCLVTGDRSLEANGRLEALELQLRAAGLEWTRVRVGHEPTIERIDDGARAARELGADVVVAVGGGSVIDAGKAIAALLANGGDTMDYLEGVGRGKDLTKPSVPFIAAPTTAGTGSEATKNAVIGNEAATFKKSMRGDGMLPAVALVDPELTYDCPAAVTAASGMDALTQLLESFTSRKSYPLTTTLAGLGLGYARYLPRLKEHPDDRDAREAMAMASLLGGVCLANAGLGAVHGLASPLGAFFPVPHGVACAVLVPAVVRANAERAAATGDRMTLEKYRTAAIQLAGMDLGAQWDAGAQIERLSDSADALAGAHGLAEQLAALIRWLGVPGLGRYNVRREDFDRVIEDGLAANSMKTNPVALGVEDLARVLEDAL